jgi:betaine lipid synthase
MASAGGNILPPGISSNYVLAGIAGVAFFALGISQLFNPADDKSDENPGIITSAFLFFYSCFIKPHEGDANGSQQAHLESFYATQSGIYDKTRKPLLKGREDMLALVAAQLQFKAGSDGKKNRDGKSRVWVDVLQFYPFSGRFLGLTEGLGWRRHRMEHRGHVGICRCPTVLL